MKIVKFHDGTAISDSEISDNVGMTVIAKILLDDANEKKVIVSNEGGYYLYDHDTQTITRAFSYVQPDIGINIQPESNYLIKADDEYIVHNTELSYVLASIDGVNWYLKAGAVVLM